MNIYMHSYCNLRYTLFLFYSNYQQHARLALRASKYVHDEAFTRLNILMNRVIIHILLRRFLAYINLVSLAVGLLKKVIL